MKIGQYFLGHTVCPRSSEPFYVVTYYIKWVALLLGHIVQDGNCIGHGEITF